jgi:hypothetical protein
VKLVRDGCCVSEIFFYVVVVAADWCHLKLFFDIHIVISLFFFEFLMVQKIAERKKQINSKNISHTLTNWKFQND